MNEVLRDAGDLDGEPGPAADMRTDAGRCRVAVRVRPPGRDEGADAAAPGAPAAGAAGAAAAGLSRIEWAEKTVTLVRGDGGQAPGQAAPENLCFAFDSVLGPEATQAEVFAACGCPDFVHAFLAGFNCCIMTYGQTGSGKTYTAHGKGGEQAGVLPRAAHMIFETARAAAGAAGGAAASAAGAGGAGSAGAAATAAAAGTAAGTAAGAATEATAPGANALAAAAASGGGGALSGGGGPSSDAGRTLSFSVMFLEIYSEEIRDLVAAAAAAAAASTGGAPSRRAPRRRPIRLVEDPLTRSIGVLGAQQVPVASYAEAMAVLMRGVAVRSTAAHLLNAESSRSHAIFTLVLESRSRASAEDVRFSKFHFVDLAGSERVKRTGTSGCRLREGISINSGLLALSNVISALAAAAGSAAAGASFVPYRDSKLTRLLQDSLGGNSKTLLIACVAPEAVNFAETANAVRYAARARRIQNAPTVNRNPFQAVVEALQNQVHGLAAQIAAHRRKALAVGRLKRRYRRRLRKLEGAVRRAREIVETELGETAQPAAEPAATQSAGPGPTQSAAPTAAPQSVPMDRPPSAPSAPAAAAAALEAAAVEAAALEAPTALPRPSTAASSASSAPGVSAPPETAPQFPLRPAAGPTAPPGVPRRTAPKAPPDNHQPAASQDFFESRATASADGLLLPPAPVTPPVPRTGDADSRAVSPPAAGGVKRVKLSPPSGEAAGPAAAAAAALPPCAEDGERSPQRTSAEKAGTAPIPTLDSLESGLPATSSLGKIAPLGTLGRAHLAAQPRPPTVLRALLAIFENCDDEPSEAASETSPRGAASDDADAATDADGDDLAALGPFTGPSSSSLERMLTGAEQGPPKPLPDPPRLEQVPQRFLPPDQTRSVVPVPRAPPPDTARTMSLESTTAATTPYNPDVAGRLREEQAKTRKLTRDLVLANRDAAAANRRHATAAKQVIALERSIQAMLLERADTRKRLQRQENRFKSNMAQRDCHISRLRLKEAKRVADQQRRDAQQEEKIAQLQRKNQALVEKVRQLTTAPSAACSMTAASWASPSTAAPRRLNTSRRFTTAAASHTLTGCFASSSDDTGPGPPASDCMRDLDRWITQVKLLGNLQHDLEALAALKKQRSQSGSPRHRGVDALRGASPAPEHLPQQPEFGNAPSSSESSPHLERRITSLERRVESSEQSLQVHVQRPSLFLAAGAATHRHTSTARLGQPSTARGAATARKASFVAAVSSDFEQPSLDNFFRKWVHDQYTRHVKGSGTTDAAPPRASHPPLLLRPQHLDTILTALLATQRDFLREQARNADLSRQSENVRQSFLSLRKRFLRRPSGGLSRSFDPCESTGDENGGSPTPPPETQQSLEAGCFDPAHVAAEFCRLPPPPTASSPADLWLRMQEAARHQQDQCDQLKKSMGPVAKQPTTRDAEASGGWQRVSPLHGRSVCAGSPSASSNSCASSSRLTGDSSIARTSSESDLTSYYPSPERDEDSSTTGAAPEEGVPTPLSTASVPRLQLHGTVFPHPPNRAHSHR